MLRAHRGQTSDGISNPQLYKLTSAYHLYGKSGNSGETVHPTHPVGMFRKNDG